MLAAIFRVCRFASLYLLWTPCHPSILPDETAELKSAGKRVEVDEKAERSARPSARPRRRRRRRRRTAAPAPSGKSKPSSRRRSASGDAALARRRKRRAEKKEAEEAEKRKRARSEHILDLDRRRRWRAPSRQYESYDAGSSARTGRLGERSRAVRLSTPRLARRRETLANGRTVHHCRPSTDREVSRRPGLLRPVRIALCDDSYPQSRILSFEVVPSRSSPPRGSRGRSEDDTPQKAARATSQRVARGRNGGVARRARTASRDGCERAHQEPGLPALGRALRRLQSTHG